MRTFAVVVLLVTIPLVGCGGSNADDQVERPSGRFSSLNLVLCEAADAADAGDEAGATGSFEDAHSALHELAAATEAVDRAVSARLLEAKQAVEADAADTEGYAALLRAVEDAVEALGGEAGKCPE